MGLLPFKNFSQKILEWEPEQHGSGLPEYRLLYIKLLLAVSSAALLVGAT